MFDVPRAAPSGVNFDSEYINVTSPARPLLDKDPELKHLRLVNNYHYFLLSYILISRLSNENVNSAAGTGDLGEEGHGKSAATVSVSPAVDNLLPSSSSVPASVPGAGVTTERECPSCGGQSSSSTTQLTKHCVMVFTCLLCKHSWDEVQERAAKSAAKSAVPVLHKSPLHISRDNLFALDDTGRSALQTAK